MAGAALHICSLRSPTQHAMDASPPPPPLLPAECGVDGVKVDVQATITMFGYDSGEPPITVPRFACACRTACSQRG